MSTTTAQQLPPATIAREAFKALANQRVAPTPENYAKAYAEQAKVPLTTVQPAIAAIESLGRELEGDPGRATLGKTIADSALAGDWLRVREQMRKLVAVTAAPPPKPVPDRPSAAAEKKPATASAVAGTTPASAAGPAASESEAVRAVKILFARTLEELVATRLGYSETLVEEARGFVTLVQAAHTRAQFEEATARLKAFWVRLDLRGEGPEPLIRALQGLLRLMLRNMGDLQAEDQWFQSQIGKVETLLDQPLTPRTLAEAERCFKEFAYRQDWLKLSLDEAKVAMKDMMAVFVDRLGTVTASAGAFSDQLTSYAERINSASDLRQLSGVMQHLLADTQTLRTSMSRAHEELDHARQQVAASEARVQELESELAKMSELVRVDPLTQVLNRRGLEMQFVIEESRARRKGTPLALAVLDLDDFKKLNDSFGHQAGDAALRHVTQTVSQAIRPTDTLARFGGEEFVVLLPETTLEAAERAMNRVQSELARRPLHWDGTQIAVTFSCGVAERRGEETQTDLIERADAALLSAKQAGKNRVAQAN